MTVPITPDQVRKFHRVEFPDGFIEHVNELISVNFISQLGTSVVWESDIQERWTGIEQQAFNILIKSLVPLYQDSGWEVVYQLHSGVDDVAKSRLFFKAKHNV